MADETTSPTRDEAIDATIHLGQFLSKLNSRYFEMGQVESAREAMTTLRLRVQLLERQMDERGIGLLQDAAGQRAVPLPNMAVVQGGPMDKQMVNVQGTHLQIRDEVIEANPAEPMQGMVTVVAWIYHLYSDGTYRLEPFGDCPTTLTENPDGGNGG